MDKEGTEWAGLAKYVKPKRFKTDEPSVEPHYEIYISTETLQSLTHEICHVIDKVAAKDQYSNKSQFKPLFNLYKQAQKEKIRDIKQSDMPKNIKTNHIAYWKHPYRNGPSEIFARFCESYLKEREELVYTNVKGLTTFDSLCDRLYLENEHQITEYFDNLFNDVLETDIDKSVDENLDNEFLYSLETLDTEVNQLKM